MAGIFIFSSYNYRSIYTPLVQIYLWEPRSKSFMFREARVWEPSTSVADAICLVVLPLQFDFRESLGSSFLLTSQCGGLHLNKYVWGLYTSTSNGSTTRQSTWKGASLVLFRSDSAPRDSLAHHPNVPKVRDVYVALLWHMAISNSKVEQQQPSGLGKSVKLDLKIQ